MQFKKNIQQNTRTQQSSGINKSNKQLQFATKISTFTADEEQNDEIKTLSKKLDLLKAGLVEERNKKKQLENLLKKNEETILKCEEENKRKQKKYQSLTAEIKKLKDELIEQRNIKSKIYQQLESKMQQINSKSSQEKKASLGLFGFRTLFYKENRSANM